MSDSLGVTVECWENQRYHPLKGWGPHRLPLDRPLWSNKKGDVLQCRESFMTPVGWVWSSAWEIEPFCGRPDGWLYAADFTIPTRFCTATPAKMSYVRRRKWTRTRRQITGQRASDWPLISSFASSHASAPLAIPLSGSSSSLSAEVEPMPPPQNGERNLDAAYATYVTLTSVSARCVWLATSFYGFIGATVEEQRHDQQRQHQTYYALCRHLERILADPLPLHGAVETPQRERVVGPGHFSDVLAEKSADAEGVLPAQLASGCDTTLGSHVGRQKSIDVPDSATESSRHFSSNASPDVSHRQSTASPLTSSLTGTTAPPAHPRRQSSPGGSPALWLRASLPRHPSVSNSVLHDVYSLGLPNCLRPALWMEWSGASALLRANSRLYESLVARADSVRSKALVEISQDVVRTAPRHPFFDRDGYGAVRSNLSLGATSKSPKGAVGFGATPGKDVTFADGIDPTVDGMAVPQPEKVITSCGAAELTEVLLALELSDGLPEYHQAFSYVVAAFLLNVPARESYWLTIVLLQRLLPEGYHGQYTLQDDLVIFEELLATTRPALYAHFTAKQVDVSVFASGWIQGCFCAHFPFCTAARFIDVMFAEGSSTVLVRLPLAYLAYFSDTLMHVDSSGTLGQKANEWARDCFTPDPLLRVMEKDGLADLVEKRRAGLRAPRSLSASRTSSSSRFAR